MYGQSNMTDGGEGGLNFYFVALHISKVRKHLLNYYAFHRLYVSKKKVVTQNLYPPPSLTVQLSVPLVAFAD